MTSDDQAATSRGRLVGRRADRERSSPDFSHIELTYVVAAYRDRVESRALADRLQTYAGYADDLLDVLQLVVVDDGSPIPIEIPPGLALNVLHLRVDEDIPWNQPGARNLGIVHARSDKVLVTDLDHELPEHTLRHLVGRRNPGRCMFKMQRMRDGRLDRAHPNTFFLSRSRFLRFYGYDEDFCGAYGFDDTMFWRWQRNHGTRFRRLPGRYYASYPNEDRGADHGLERDLEPNRRLADEKKELWRRFGPAAGHSRRFLSFTWSVVEDRCRPPANVRLAERPLWAKTWFVRWLFGGGW